MPRLLAALLFGAASASPPTPTDGPPHAGLAALPPLLQFANGTAVRSLAEWPQRRTEVAALLDEHYYGTAPTVDPPLTSAKVTPTHAAEAVGRGYREENVELTFSTPKGPATFTIDLLVPDMCTKADPCPTFMTQANQRRWGLVGLPRGYILLSYPGADSNDQTDVFRLTYPEATWGMIRRRAWLGSRALDYVLSQPWAHKDQVAITGHSRNGKQSLIAAAYDERITAVADSSSGSPAGSPYRLTSAWTFAEDPYGGWPSCNHAAANHCDCGCDLSNVSQPDYAKPLGKSGGRDPRCCWWKPSIMSWEGRENECPIDSHGLYALIAPRHVVGEHAMTDGCDPTFAVEGGYIAGREVYRFMGAEDRFRIDWRQGQHHGFESLDRYFDFFDVAFGRAPKAAGTVDLSIEATFPEKLLHTFDWNAWNSSVGGPVADLPPAGSKAAIEWGLGEAPSTGPGWSPGGEYGLLDWDYIQPMLSRSPSGYPEKQMITHNITQVAVNFAEYSYAQMWWGPEKQPDDSDVATPSKGRKAVIWLHPYSYQNGYHADYAQGATAMYERLAKAGYVVIAFDQVGFGLRTLQGTRFYQRYPRWSKLGRMVRDVSSAVDVLLSDQNDYTLATHPSGLPVGKYMATDWPAIDPKHIYVAGYALGGLVSLYANALEPRLAGAASIAGISPLRSQENAHRTGGNDLISKWHSIQPRLGWYEGVEGAKIPYDYDDVIAVAKKPTLVIAPEADRTADHPALLALLARAKLKLGSNDGLLSVNTTSYEPPMPNPTGSHASPAVGINRLDNAHQSTLVEWLDWVSSPKL